MRPLWMTRLARLFNAPTCLECGCRTEGGLVCDVCGQKLIEATRDKIFAQIGPRPM